MILLGQYDSPYTRRVAISMQVLGIPYEHDTRSVFGDFEAIRAVNPLRRIPALTLDDGTVLIDSAAILDWLDESAGPGRALIPASGIPRRTALKTIALACGAIEKIGAANYERLIRPAAYRWPDWIERCLTQCLDALDALEAQTWRPHRPLDQAHITTGCFLSYVRLTDPGLMPRGRFPDLWALADALDERPEFQATAVVDYAVPRG